MNLVMVEVTDIEAATGSALQAGEVATLLGADGDANITAAQFADWSSTIHYEIISRIHPCVPRHRVAQSD
jgi:alanine racemase